MTTLELKPVRVRSGKDMLQLTAPYHPSFPRLARALGGMFNGDTKLWYFDPRDEARVREVCREVYGIDPGDEAPAPTRTISVALDQLNTENGSLWLVGREVASRPARDAKVRLGPGVIIVTGGFADRGGSAKYPRLAPLDGTIVEIRDVPLPLVERAKRDFDDAITVVDEPSTTPPVAPTPVEFIKARFAALSAEERRTFLDWLAPLLSANTREEES